MGMIATKIPGLYYNDGERGRSYLIDKDVDGDRLYLRIGRVSLSEARAIYTKECGAFQNGKTPTVNARSLTVTDILNLYWKEHLSHLNSGKNAKYLLSAVADRLGRVRFSELNKTVIQDYKRMRLQDTTAKTNKKISARTVQAELAMLNAAVYHCVDNEILSLNPISRFCSVSLKPPKKVVLDEGQADGEHWQTIYANACKGWEKYRPDAYRLNRLLLLALYETGCRPIEAFRMRHNWFVEIEPGFWLIRIPEEDEKTDNRQREIPVSDILMNGIKEILIPGKDDLLFPSTSTYLQRGNSGIRKTFDHAVERSKLDAYGYTVYCLRKTRITIWDMIDEAACRVAVGHTAKDSHRRSYSYVGYDRLFNLVGKSYKNRFRLAKVG